MRKKTTLLSQTGGLLAVGIFSMLATTQAQAACYEVYSSDHQLVYRSQRTPVDLSKQLHQTVPQLLKGSKLVFTPNGQGCEIEYNRLQPQAVVEIEGEGFRTVTPRPPARPGKS